MPTQAEPVGLLVMAHGSPATEDEVEAYYTHIRRGRSPQPSELAELVARYRAIGGTSIMADRTRSQVTAITSELERREPGRWAVAEGAKHAPPFIEDAASALASSRRLVVGLVLAPQYSRHSVGEYHDRAAAAVGAAGAEYRGIDCWHREAAFTGFLAAAVTRSLAELPDRSYVLFTAHSLPLRLMEDDPYADQLTETAEAAAGRAGLGPDAWRLCYQSAARTGEPWAGPDVVDVVGEVASAGEVAGVAVCPIGFASDHLEVLYDLDVVVRERAEANGIAYSRAATVNDDPAVMAALARRAIARAAPM